jgi:putative transcriptional regulator
MKISHKQYKFTPNSGQLLVSEPFLADPNFRKTVVLLCEHEAQGSVGFIINRLLDVDTDEIIPGLLNVNFPIYYGGPVEQNTLHFIHKAGLLIDESFPVGDDIFWGGNIDQINILLESGKATEQDFKFFIGYSGWGEGQLEAEIDQKAWWLTHLIKEEAFNENIEDIWPKTVRTMGKDFAYLADAPEDYNWN